MVSALFIVVQSLKQPIHEIDTVEVRDPAIWYNPSLAVRLNYFNFFPSHPNLRYTEILRIFYERPNTYLDKLSTNRVFRSLPLTVDRWYYLL